MTDGSQHCVQCGYAIRGLHEQGRCPECGAPVQVGEHASVQDPLERAVPWHFWVGVAAVTAYLGWRVIQGFWLLF